MKLEPHVEFQSTRDSDVSADSSLITQPGTGLYLPLWHAHVFLEAPLVNPHIVRRFPKSLLQFLTEPLSSLWYFFFFALVYEVGATKAQRCIARFRSKVLHAAWVKAIQGAMRICQISGALGLETMPVMGV